ncbi:telomere length regulation protein TEL2 homolog [Bombina bombina]|uniref:telomere length regulation protein TEL2 homolog n=1 Tax=Bombina bombina TaxID=8345 RepID=UPI00235AF6E4|nr:telomere length regulation protein TEL2 homolog [Bombina bombina]
MDQDSATPVHDAVRDTMSEISTISDGERLAELLNRIKYYLGADENSAPAHEKAEFTRTHYTPFLRLLVAQMGPQWMDLLTSDRLELWDSFFLEGPADQAFLVLMESFGRSGLCTRLDRCVLVLERFLQRGSLAGVIWEVCQQNLEANHTSILHEAILGRICSLPDHLANCLQKRNKPLFYPNNYYPLVGSAILRVLQMVSDSLRDGKGCSISFVSQVLGKICMQGRHTSFGRKVIQATMSSKWELPSFCCICTSHGLSAWKEMLQTILGYLSMDESRRPLLLKVLHELLEVWSSGTVVKHSPHAQHLHLSRAILICLSLLNQQELGNCKQDLLSALTSGTRHYLDSSVPSIRHLGMVVAECLSRHIDSQAPSLSFQYEEDEEIKELKSLLTPLCVCPQDAPTIEKTPIKSSPSKVKSANNTSVETGSKSDSELDSDDDLEPYDMSADTEMKKSKTPKYIRDCIEVLLSDDLDKVEVTLNSLVALIWANPVATKEVSVELTKILLHLDDKPGVERFAELRYSSLVALTVLDPVPVSQYLTGEFYAVNYSLRQRMDILDVLASAAQNLSKISTPAHTLSSNKSPQIVTSSQKPDSPVDWKKVVEERIKSKTRRFAKGSSAPAQVSVPNRFHAVAGHFFFPLIQNFDRPMVTFNLLGDDRLVLGRMVHTLGILMHLALHATIASQMGKALLEFVWVLRFHIDSFVRQGLLFCISTVLLSVPWERLMTDMSEEVLEMQCWLADVAEKDPDDDCRRLALNGLVLMEKLRNNIKGPTED